MFPCDDLNVRLTVNASLVLAFVIRTASFSKCTAKRLHRPSSRKTASANLSAVNMGIKSIEIFLNVIEKTDTADAALESDMPEI